MEQIVTEEYRETENAVTRPRLRWVDFVVIMLALSILVAGVALPTFAVEPKRELVVVTRNVCQPPPTATAHGEWRP